MPETTKEQNYRYNTKLDAYVDNWHENQKQMLDMLTGMKELIKEKGLGQFVETVNRNFIRFRNKGSNPIYLRIVGEYIYVRQESEHITILLKKVILADIGIREFLDIVRYINKTLEENNED